jgi:hypothetical protein
MIDPITEHILEQEQLDEAFIIIPIIPGLEKIVLPISLGVIGLTAIMAAASFISVKVRKKKFPACKKYSVNKTPGHFHLCLAKEKIALAKQEISTLNKLKTACRKTKDTNKCESKINEKMQKVKKRIVMLSGKLDRLQQYANSDTRGN